MRGAVEQGIDGGLKLLERLFRAGRRLPPSLAVDQENYWITSDVAIEVWDLPTQREKRITHRDLFPIPSLDIDPNTIKPLPLRFWYRRSSFGISFRQGSHHVAQILTSATSPLWSPGVAAVQECPPYRRAAQPHRASQDFGTASSGDAVAYRSPSKAQRENRDRQTLSLAKTLRGFRIKDLQPIFFANSPLYLSDVRYHPALLGHDFRSVLLS
jgi:hypothetical protein